MGEFAAIAVTSPLANTATEEDMANAKLISAAPDLLNALILARMSLKEIAKEAYEHGSVGANIDAAILKATK